MTETIVVGDEEHSDEPSVADVSEAAGTASAHAQAAAADASDASSAAGDAQGAAAGAEHHETVAEEHADNAEEHAGAAGEAAESALTAEREIVSMIEALPDRIAEAVHARIKAAEPKQEPQRTQRRPPKPAGTHPLFRKIGGKRNA